MARDSDLRPALDMISGRSRKGRKQRSGTAWYNVLRICFGPRVSPLLLKGEAVEITSLVALFCGSFPRIRVFGCKRSQHSNSVVLLQSFLLSFALTLWPVLTIRIKCMTTSFHARRRSIKQPSKRLYAVFKNVHRLSQLLRSHSSRHNLRSLARSFLRLFRFSHIHLCRMLELYLVFHRYQEFNRRLRRFYPLPDRHFHHLQLDPVEQHRL